MNPPKPKPVIVSAAANELPTPRLGSVVRKSALFNAVIVLTSFPVLVSAGGPNAVVPTLAIMAGISILIWIATLALFSFASLPRIFRAPVSSLKRSELVYPATEARIADRWLDAPV